MSSNRLKYDTCAYATTIKESTEPLEYYLYKGKYETCTQCPNGNFTNNIEFSSRADVESELFGLTRPGTDCPSLKYDPTKSFNNPSLSPPTMCQSIYGLTPSNLVNPTTNMLNENNLGINLCSIKPNTNIIEKFTSTFPLVLLLKGYDNISEPSITMNLYDKVEEGIDNNKVLDAVNSNTLQVNIQDIQNFYKSNITQQQISFINNKINNYNSCSLE